MDATVARPEIDLAPRDGAGTGSAHLIPLIAIAVSTIRPSSELRPKRSAKGKEQRGCDGSPEIPFSLAIATAMGHKL